MHASADNWNCQQAQQSFETVAKLESILRASGITWFALVDHSGEAEKAGMKMPPTKLLLPLMPATHSIAIDLALKIPVAEDAAGKTWISFHSLSYLKERHSLPGEFVPVLAAVEVLASSASI